MLKFFDQWRSEGREAQVNGSEATGTYADGVFYLTREQAEMQTRPERLRASYERDYRAANRMADRAPIYC